MKLRTKIQLKPKELRISTDSTILFIGSCFSQNIGTICRRSGIDTIINPTGIIFHPQIIIDHLHHTFDDSDSLFTQSESGTYYHHMFHSSFSADHTEGLSDLCMDGLKRLHHSVITADHVFITLGSAWYYKHLNTRKIINNCHKQHPSFFSKAMSSVSECIDMLMEIVSSVKVLNPSVHIHFTLSPVRHIRYGMIENARAKSILHTAIHEIVSSHSDVSYFPSYEIMLDDLRDYRFYAEDMVHPSALAVAYIWQCFLDHYFDPTEILSMKKVSQFMDLLDHRLLDNSTKSRTAHREVVQQKFQILSASISNKRLELVTEYYEQWKMNYLI